VKVEAVRWVAEFGLEHRNLAGVEAIGVDEIHWGKGQQYLTPLVYQIDAGCRRLLYVGRERTAKTLLRFFHDMGHTWCSGDGLYGGWQVRSGRAIQFLEFG
jgi:hypothetical protein